ncbi:MAG: hypothetical protein ACFB9N_01240 [Geitlerinemataceae cyanobacterium]
MDFSLFRRAPLPLRHLAIAVPLAAALAAMPAAAQISSQTRLPSVGASFQDYEDREWAVGEERYLVFVDSSRERRLREVQSFYPLATFGDLDDERVIQAGLFELEADAADRQALLRDRGFDAEVTLVRVAAPQRTTRPRAEASLAESAYYVVVPSDDALELETLAVSLQELFGTSVALRSAPFGAHLAIGPFGRRGAAEAVAEDLQGREFDNARVYYERGGSIFEELF